MNLEKFKNLKLISKDIDRPELDEEKVELNSIVIDQTHRVFEEVCKLFDPPKEGQDIKLIIISTPKDK